MTRLGWGDYPLWSALGIRPNLGIRWRHQLGDAAADDQRQRTWLVRCGYRPTTRAVPPI